MTKNPVLSVLVLFPVLLLAPLTSEAQLGSRDTVQLDERPEPLPQEQAFPWFVSITGADSYSVTWQPAPRHYLYRHQFAFFLESNDGQAPVPVAFELPAGQQKNDQFFGDVEAYYDRVTARLSLPGSTSGPRTLRIRYQGCADWGFCYPPQEALYPLNP